MEQDAPEGQLTVKEFRKKNPQLRGKRIILCDHLKNRSMSFISINLWIGDNSRILLCPICAKLHKQTTWEAIIGECFFAIDVTRKAEYSNWLQKAGKEK